ncbi:MAG TPA: GNAT family N-acetyltransferase [Solirubrobacteraceae bacterium]|nr:GNAT family N-acetyltransferase [Solirubrobacteraceae bacterium]
MRRELGHGFELDDDRGRLDVAAIHAYISGESYWGRGRPRELVQLAIDGSRRVVGLYHRGAQVGFARAVSDGATVAYLADVYVLAEHRGRGLGLALVREMIEGERDDGGRGARSPAAGPGGRDVRWLLHTADAQGLYAKLGFTTGPPQYPLMERTRDGGGEGG